MRARLIFLAVLGFALGCGKSNGGSSSGATSGSGGTSSSGTSTSTATSTATSGSGTTSASGSSGSSGAACTCPQVACGDTCVDLGNDTNNCGACGVVCNGPCGNTTCLNGTCQPPPYYSCTTGGAAATGTGTGGGSTSSSGTSSSGSSGSSGASCFHTCTNTSDCPSGYTCEPPPITSTTGGVPSNSCQPCEWPMLLCNGQCVHGDQVDNCGACGNACGDFQACVNGQCACKTHDDGCGRGCACTSGQQLCGDTCSDTQTDRAHCGDCATACAANQLCVGGHCSPVDGGAPLDAFTVAFVSVPGDPTGIGLADLNGDGHPDLAVATEYSTGDAGVGAGQLLAALNDGSGAFGAFAVQAGTSESLALGDLNADGKVDAVVADYANQQLLVFYGDGAGGFTSGSALGVPCEPEVVRIADFNHDGKPDLFVEGLNYANPSSLYEFDVILNQGNGSFSAAVTTASAAAVSSIYRGQDGFVGDVNGDGNADVTAGGALYLGKGDGTFEAPVPLGAGTVTTGADLDGDGHPDLVMLGGGDVADGCTLDAVRVLRGYGDGGFAPADVYGMPESPRLAAAGKFTGGAKPDLAVIFGQFYGHAEDFAMLLRNDGTGHFTLDLQRYDLGDAGYPVQAVVGDLDADGRDDLLVSQLYKNRVAVLRSR